MLRQSQALKLQQKLSPQQIQLMKLIQLPTQALEERIQEELEVNPALETESQVDEDPSFTVTGPRIWAPDPTITSFSKVGCLLIPTCSEDLIAGDTPPKVTP